MAKKKIINVYLSFPFVGRTKKNIEATMNYMKYEAEKYLRGLPDFPHNSEIRFWSLYDITTKEPIVCVGNEKHVTPNAYKKLHGKKRSLYTITAIAYKLAECDYYFTFDPRISISCVYYFLGNSKLQKLYDEVLAISQIEEQQYILLQHGYKNMNIFDFHSSYTAIQAFPEFIKLNRQNLIRYIRKINTEKKKLTKE